VAQAGRGRFAVRELGSRFCGLGFRSRFRFGFSQNAKSGGRAASLQTGLKAGHYKYEQESYGPERERLSGPNANKF